MNGFKVELPISSDPGWNQFFNKRRKFVADEEKIEIRWRRAWNYWKIGMRVALGSENEGQERNRRRERERKREWKVVWKIETETRQLLPRLRRLRRVQPVECGHCCRMWVSLGVLPVESSRWKRRSKLHEERVTEWNREYGEMGKKGTSEKETGRRRCRRLNGRRPTSVRNVESTSERSKLIVRHL